MPFFKQIRVWILLAICVIATPAFAGDFVVIGNAINSPSKQDIADIYLGKRVKLENGLRATPVDLSAGQPREEFYRQIIRKDEYQLRSYWTLKLYSGRGTPPRVVNSEKDAVEFVARTKGAIAYVRKSSVTSGVKVIFEY